MKKQIRVKTNLVLELSYEEFMVHFKGVKYAKFTKLMGLVRGGFIEKEDLEQEVDIAFWKSYRDFDINKKWVIGSYIENHINKIYQRVLNYHQRKDRDKVKVCSMQVATGDNSTFEDSVEDDSCARSVAEVISKMMASKLEQDIREVLTTRQQEILSYLLQDKKVGEIGKELGILHCTVSAIRKTIQNKTEKIIENKWHNIGYKEYINSIKKERLHGRRGVRV